jgi:hypothetical protein
MEIPDEVWMGRMVHIIHFQEGRWDWESMSSFLEPCNQVKKNVKLDTIVEITILQFSKHSAINEMRAN